MKLKVIGGSLKGKPLASPKGLTVRPTAGRVREAVFNILYSRIQGAVVLDLFAGTGAFGIEALSRGASRVVFVDNSPASLAVIRRNIQACGLEQKAAVIRQDATRCLSVLPSGIAFDVVFMDPPYGRRVIACTLAALDESRGLKHGSLVIAEHALKESVKSSGDRFFLTDQRKYGGTLVSFFEYMIN